ncbi:MAG: hypothetical protein IJ634_00500 [Bacteroidales bacterium]|nr:hypothetical protein [Bacteroidales bacterium]
MAKVGNGINDGFRGTVGTVVGYMWRGQWCMRSKPRFYHDAKTEAQLEHRALFKATVAYAGRVKEVLHVGLHRPALDAHKTVCNYFLKINKKCFSMVAVDAASGEGDAEAALAVDYASLRVSEGPVAPVGFGVPEMVDECTFRVAFEKNPEHRRANASDKVYIAMFNAESGEAVLSLPVYRWMKVLTATMPAEWAGQEVHLYGFVQDLDGRTSESTYLGGGIGGEVVDDEGVVIDDVDGGEGVSAGVAAGLSAGLRDVEGEPAADGLVEAEAVHVVEGG